MRKMLKLVSQACTHAAVACSFAADAMKSLARAMVAQVPACCTTTCRGGYQYALAKFRVSAICGEALRELAYSIVAMEACADASERTSSLTSTYAARLESEIVDLGTLNTELNVAFSRVERLVMLLHPMLETLQPVTIAVDAIDELSVCIETTVIL